MQLPEEELLNEYLMGEEIDPCEYDAFALEKFDEILGRESDWDNE